MVSYWSEGTRLHRVCSVQNGRRPYCPGELVSMQMRYASGRGPTRRTDGRMDETGDEVSLPLYFNSLCRYLLVSPISFHLPSSPVTILCFFHGEFDTSFLSLSPFLSPPLLFLHLCVSTVGPPPPPVVDNSTSHLVLLSHSSIPRLPLSSFFDFPYLSFLLLSTFLGGPTVFASLILSFLSAHPAPTQYLSTFSSLCRPIVCGALLPAYSYARSSL